MMTLLAVLALQVPDVVGYEKDPWNGFAVGSWVRLKRTAADKVDETTYTLAEIKTGYKRIKLEPPPEDEVEAKYGVLVPFVPYTQTLKGLGLQVNGKGSDVLKVGVKASMQEFGPADPGQAWFARLRVAVSDELPGGLGKVVLDVAGDRPRKVTYEAVAREKLKIDGREAECVRFDLEQAQGKNERTQGSVWLSPAVPGLMAKARLRTTTGRLTTEQAVECVAFEAKK